MAVTGARAPSRRIPLPVARPSRHRRRAATGDADAAAARAQPVEDPQPSAPLAEDSLGNKSLDELNRDSPLRAGVLPARQRRPRRRGPRGRCRSNAEVLQKHPPWQVTIEGHCDERGTAEYNLALGERRAVAAKTYMVSLGIAADRLRTVSYGKEFPFDPGPRPRRPGRRTAAPIS